MTLSLLSIEPQFSPPDTEEEEQIETSPSNHATSAERFA